MRKPIMEGPARYVLAGAGALGALIFLVTRFSAPPAAPPVVITNALPASTALPPAQGDTSNPAPRTRHRKAASAITTLPENPPSSTTILVDVEGAVEHPKVYQLPSGSRLFQALKIAGGPTKDAEVATVNQAEILSDGEQVRVFTKEEEASRPRRRSTRVRSSRRKSKASGKMPPKILTGAININTASLGQLEQIPGVGAVTAQRILDERQAIGSFRDSSDLMEIDGMTPSKYEKMRPFISIR